MKPAIKPIRFGKATSLLLENFKAFGRRQRIPIRPITLIYGRNNSGKSSIIQALLYAEHVQRTGDFDPAEVSKDNRSVLEGGLSRIVHGHGSRQPRLGWEWKCEGGATGIHSGSYMQTLIPRGLIAEASLNGESFFTLTGEEDTWLWPAPNREHPLYRAAIMNVQRWIAAEHRRNLARKEGTAEFRAQLQSACEDLEAGNFRGNIEEILFSEEWGGGFGLQFKEPVTLPPSVRFFSQLDYEWDKYFVNPLPGYRPTSRLAMGFEEADRAMREADSDMSMELVWGLQKSVGDPITEFFAQRGAFILCRWLEDVWAHVAIPLMSLVGAVHYLGAVRSRPDRIVLRDPRDASGLKPFEALWKRPSRTVPQHPDWVFDPGVIRRANAWLNKREHRKLTGNIQIRSAAISPRRHRGSTRQTAGAVTLSVFDRDRKVELSLSEAGFGLSQFLPVLLACFAHQSGEFGLPAAGTLLVEEPEAHVHPALQSEIGDLFLDAVTRADSPLAHIICETHSEHLLLRLQRRVREGKLSPNQIAVLYVENVGKESVVQEMPLDKEGRLVRDWPGGFFEEGLRDVLM